MKLPKHVNLTIEHQPHATNYETVDEWLARDEGYADICSEDRAKIIETGEIWVIHWYPETPVGFCAVAAATLERALELALDEA